MSIFHKTIDERAIRILPFVPGGGGRPPQTPPMSNCPDRVCPDNWNPHANRSFSRVRSRDRSWGRSRERPRGRDREDFGDDKVWGRDVFRVRVGGIGRQAFQSAVSNGYMASMKEYVRPPVPWGGLPPLTPPPGLRMPVG